MAEAAPRVYVLHGGDEYSLENFLQSLLEGMGDPTMAAMNTARLDGRQHTLEELVQAAHAMPFLAPRRVVIFRHPLERAKNAAQQKKLLDILAKSPDSTSLALVEDHTLTNERDRKRKIVHWLERWAGSAGPDVQLKGFPLPQGAALAQWIQARARTAGGQFSPQAAGALADLVGPEPRILQQEIVKLLEYVNFARPVDPEDVHHLTPTVLRADDFALVNALRAHDTRQALRMLRIELEDKDPIPLLQSIVGQFRNLLLVRELLQQGGGEEEAARLLKIHPYVAKLALEQARRFTLEELEQIYRQLLAVDEAIKTGDMESETALDVLVSELTGAAVRR